MHLFFTEFFSHVMTMKLLYGPTYTLQLRHGLPVNIGLSCDPATYSINEWHDETRNKIQSCTKNV